MTISTHNRGSRQLAWEKLNAALSELSEEQKDVFEQTALMGLPAEEVAWNLRIPVDTVLSRRRYIVLYLRDQLKALYAEIFEE